jgi:cysteine desulfurase
MHNPIYLDYMATTPVDPRVVEKTHYCLIDPELCGNSASSHSFGLKARAVIEESRQQVAALLQADPQEIIWTSGATEANNLALKGVMAQKQYQKRHIITALTEHKSVLEVCRYLEGEGCSVTYLKPNAKGVLDLSEIANAIRADTVLVSIMHVNSEIGVIQDIKSIGEFTRQKGILFHVDAAQSAGKVPINLQEMPVDLMTFSAHKMYGPKGIGALFVRSKPRVRLLTQLHGGGHEAGLRSGTLATHQIVGMGAAFAIANQEMMTEVERVTQLRNYFWDQLQQQIPQVYLNGDLNARVCGNLNICIPCLASEALLLALHNVIFSISSACNSVTSVASPVLKAIGLSDEESLSSLRLSIGRFTTKSEIDEAAARMAKEVARLRALSPNWQEVSNAL